MSLFARIDAEIAKKRLLDHPFYAAWSAGALSKEALSRYAEQYYHWTRAFPTFLSLAHAQSDDIELRQQVLLNLNEEEAGPDNHPELWLRFCDALGLDREAVKNGPILPETREAIDLMRSTCGTQGAIPALAALYAYESQQPEVMKTKREGLVRFYGIDGVNGAHDFFTAHESADVVHSSEERKLIASRVEGTTAEEALMPAVQASLAAIYRLLDGVYTRYVHADCAVPAAA